MNMIVDGVEFEECTYRARNQAFYGGLRTMTLSEGGRFQNYREARRFPSVHTKNVSINQSEHDKRHAFVEVYHSPFSASALRSLASHFIEAADFLEGQM